MAGIQHFGAYLPWRRLDRAAAASANRWLNPGLMGLARGSRTMASWDEDPITLSVEAARISVRERSAIEAVHFASSTAPFADRQNAGVVASALLLPASLRASDHGGSQRAGTSALLAALDGAQARDRTALVVAADRRKAPAASAQELQFGDAGAAIVVGAGDGAARYLGGGSVTTDFVDHYREADRDFDYQWEERWVRDEGLRKIVPSAIRTILESSGVSADSIDHFIFPSSFRGADAEIAASVGIAKDKVRPNLSDVVGDTGVPHALLMLAHALEDAKPGERILLAAFGQGCDVLLFETTEAIAEAAPATTVARQLEAGKPETNYMRYLVFNDLVEWDRGKRAERDKQTALTTLYRKKEMITGLTGGECQKCGTRQFPSVRICVNPNCRAIDSQQPYPFADLPAKIISWSGDHLVFTLDPPLHYGMVGFAEGGRILVEFADCEPEEIGTGAPVRMAFRVKDYDSLRGFRRYFWKAVPDRSARQQGV